MNMLLADLLYTMGFRHILIKTTDTDRYLPIAHLIIINSDVRGQEY